MPDTGRVCVVTKGYPRGVGGGEVESLNLNEAVPPDARRGIPHSTISPLRSNEAS